MHIEFDPKFAPHEGAQFAQPLQVIRADHPDEVTEAFTQIDRAQAQGRWLAGMFSYELGYVFEPTLLPLLPKTRDVPLLEVGVYAAPEALTARAKAEATTTLSPTWDQARYDRAFQTIRENLAAGHIYQANLTFQMAVEAGGDPRALYEALAARQSVGYGAYVKTEGRAILSRSPELFFETDATGAITVRPMKGTAPPGGEAWLAASEKNQAENVMIVDLLRNDLSRICEVGSVKTPKLFEIERYETVYQMTSTVTGQLIKGLSTHDLFRALFPCGSITGAPKIRAMELIREVEDGPRGLYCGAIGWMAPDGRKCFNVAIRTLTQTDVGRYEMGVGGGVVYDSRSQSEYEEALLKATFAAL